MKFIIRVLATAAAVAVAAWLLPGVAITGASRQDQALVLLAVAAIIGVVNALVKPLAQFVSTCAIILTLGLFLFVINAAMLMLVSWIAGELNLGFHVDGFWWALAGSVVISVVSGFINGVLGTSKSAE
ncbi:phage holin family protein [Propionibacteriaceae bacterium G1746]|uniref:phage holin family protein n=1 Tax=Aestuariimicrobium sp. G57 TaxID=3418485 RepID=UPI003C258A86